MRDIVFASEARKDFEKWAKQDKKAYLRILALIQDIDMHPYNGIGKPEPLKYELAGFWSRRINNTDRIVYQISSKNEIIIIACKGHYGNK